MRIVAVEPTRATVELSMEELGLLMNALWQELGYQAPRRRALEEDSAPAATASRRTCRA